MNESLAEYSPMHKSWKALIRNQIPDFTHNHRSETERQLVKKGDENSLGE